MAVKRSKKLVWTGLLVLLVLYVTQACLLVNFMAEKINSRLWFCLFLFLPAFIIFMIFIYLKKGLDKAYADDDEEAWVIWIIWGIYIIAGFVPSVAVIFFKVVNKLDSHETLGPNALKSVLCITPALLILLLHLTISPSYRKSVMTISVLTALDIFDGIEMLEIVLMQKERENFDLNGNLEISMIAFACIGFVISSLGLSRNELCDNGEVKERPTTSIVFGSLKIVAINLPFLILRIIVWVDYGYEASIFIAKNIISLVIGAVEIGVLCDCCECGDSE